MSNQDKDYITIYDEDGNESLYEILFTFDSDDYGKSYVLLVPTGLDEDEEEVEILAFSYTEDEDGETGSLEQIEAEDEWDMVEEVLNTFLGD